MTRPERWQLAKGMDAISVLWQGGAARAADAAGAAADSGSHTEQRDGAPGTDRLRQNRADEGTNKAEEATGRFQHVVVLETKTVHINRLHALVRRAVPRVSLPGRLRIRSAMKKVQSHPPPPPPPTTSHPFLHILTF